ncbi:MAG: T9SS type A sorting domain-containing protein, partial [Ignavibacteria bacterium]|nr:T9SS type A sorting domain-containing protein [Ignavibacteria bacterium]
NAYWYDGSGYVIENNLMRGKGYWLKFNQSQNITIPVVTSNSISINVNQGWNLIGSLHNEVAVSNVVSNPPNIIVTPFYGYDKRYYQASSLKVGKGYWVKTNQAGTLILSLLIKSNFSNQFEISTKELPYIIFIAEDGFEQKLYFTSAPLNYDFELPPIPPQGSFDVRFANNSFVTDLNDQAKEVLIQSNTRNVKVFANGLDFKISSLSGNYENDVIVESGNEKVLNINLSHKLIVQPILNKLEFKLMQNFPNPFNSQTRINFSLPKDEFVQLKLFNILGEEVKILLNDKKTKGYHSVDLNISDLPSGTYIYQLKAGNFIENKKLIFIK